MSVPRTAPEETIPSPAKQWARQPDTTRLALDEIARLIAQFEAETGCEPTVLDWNSGLELADSLKQGVAIVPPLAAELNLPYLDSTFDFVAVPAINLKVVHEAQRVAARGVFLIEQRPDQCRVVMRTGTSAHRAATSLLGSKHFDADVGLQLGLAPAVTPGLRKRRALVCAPQLPEFDRKSGSRRIWDAVADLRAGGWEVVLLAVDGRGLERYARLLRKSGVEVVIEADCCIDRLIVEGRFDLLLLGFWYVAERYLELVRALSPSTRIIIDSIDLHFVREARRGSVGPRYADETSRELAVYAQAGRVLTVSPNEAEILGSVLGDSQIVAVVPDGEDLDRSTVPFAERQGIVFLGNFRHPPNADAVRFLCNEIMPNMEPAVLAEHPIRVVGNQPDDEVLDLVAGRPDVRMVGWVPTVVPELQHARISVIPLRYGAGTKRKLIQALMTGTPTVSTSIGVEGLDLVDGEHVLIADDPKAFASAVARLVADRALWERLAEQGRAHVLARHHRAASRSCFLKVIADVLASPPGENVPRPGVPGLTYDSDRLTSIPHGTLVVVAGIGEPQPRSWRGPESLRLWRDETPVDFPASGRDAVARLKAFRSYETEYLFVPSHSLWWLSSFPELVDQLGTHANSCSRDERGALYHFNAKHSSSPGLAKQSLCVGMRPRVLVAGIYLADAPNHAESIVATLAESVHYDIKQHWVALGWKPPSAGLSAVTCWTQRSLEPKFAVINRLLAEIDWTPYEYVIVCDDDILLPPGFVDGYLRLQTEAGFLLAQPARTENSHIDHPIVGQQRGVRARQTLFVEVGPLFSVHRSIAPLLLPFDLTSPMGWGYENVWARKLRDRSLKMGIIDAFPVDHSLRPPTVHYVWHEAAADLERLLQSQPHLPLEECYRVLDIIPEE